MAARERLATSAAFLGTNSYVPAMQYASNVVTDHPVAFSLGTPAAVSANAIAAAQAADAVANTAVNYSYTTDSKYGRTLRLTPSANPGNAAAIDIFGFDYLGQPMVERFTGASGSTAILYGKKAFFRVTQGRIATASTNAGVTWAIGTGFGFGLPYKGDVAWAKEAGIQIPINKRDVEIFSDRSAAEAVAGASRFIRVPFPGFVKSLVGIAAGNGGATNPVVTVRLGGVAITGLTVTPVTNSAGNTVTSTPTTPGYNANNRLRTNDLVEVVAAAAAGAGNDRLGLVITPTQVALPDLTDPNTRTSGDPRGTYEPLLAPDGVSEIIVGLVGDNSVNASGNGGFHGLRHAGS
jgi:hypothetical protein